MEAYLKGLIKQIKRRLKEIDWLDHLRISMSHPTVQLKYDKDSLFGFAVQEVRFDGNPTIIVTEECIVKIQDDNDAEVLAEYNSWEYFH